MGPIPTGTVELAREQSRSFGQLQTRTFRKRVNGGRGQVRREEAGANPVTDAVPSGNPLGRRAFIARSDDECCL